ncbi:tetraspanin-3-like [Coffea eugenioides]|uniref:tetraspanin-3-like n=1 Tax=Coffea eugenioides TaxID=49369 RepID=UPI000F6136C3|nr:tetraspanin-3-like [Coffea eugenioides]
MIWLGISSTASLIVQSVHDHCWKLSSKDLVIIGFLAGCPLALLLSSNLALLYIRMNHRRRFVATFLFNVALGLAFFVALILFLIMVVPTEETWKAKYVNEDHQIWLPIQTCLEQRNFCRYFPKVDGCCQRPSNCKGQKLTQEEDCSKWRLKSRTSCYSCKECKSAIYSGIKPHGGTVEQALIVFAVAALFVVIFQVVIFWKGWDDIERDEW